MSSNAEKQYDIAIVGGGVLGVSLCYHLRHTRLKIAIIEKESGICQHASAKNAGMIRSLYANEQLSEWALESIHSFPEKLKKEFFQHTGSIVCDRVSPSHHVGAFKDGTSTYRGKDISYVYASQDGLMDSESYVQGLWKLTHEEGNIDFHKKTQLKGLSKLGNGNWSLECDNNLKITAPIVVNAAGAWLNSFLEAALQSEAQAFARHLFLAKQWNNQQAIHDLPSHGFFWDEKEAWYMRSWDKNALLLSACDEEATDPDNYSPNPDVLESLSAKMLKAVPHIAESLHIHTGWHCFRTYHPDTLPLWGEDPTEKGLFWLCAFGGYGMSTSFAASKDLAHLITRGISKVEPSVLITSIRKYNYSAVKVA